MAKKYNCTKNGKQYYRISRTINGKRKEFYGDGEKDAIRQYTEYMKQIELGFDPEAAKRKFGEAFEEWLYHIHKYNVKESSLRGYDVAYRCHIKDAPFKDKSLSAIRRSDIEMFASKKYDAGLSTGTIKQMLQLLSAFFRYQVLSDVLPKNPTYGVKPPRNEADDLNKIEVFTKEEQQSIIEESRKIPNGFLFELALVSGMRIAELLALEYGDFTTDGVWVNRNQVIVKDENDEWVAKLTSPKSKTGHRFIPLPPYIFTLLEEHKRAQIKRLNGVLSKRVFTTRTGAPLRNSAAEALYLKFTKGLPFPHKKFHTFRHTFITNCIQAGMDIVTVQELAGHSSLEMTRRYTHISTEHKVREVQKLYANLPTVGRVWEQGL